MLINAMPVYLVIKVLSNVANVYNLLVDFFILSKEGVFAVEFLLGGCFYFR